jgi:hypothetical protein
MLWFQSKLTSRNILIVALVLFLTVFQVYPFSKWAVLTLDKHYFGYLSERVPRLALTTQ